MNKHYEKSWVAVDAVIFTILHGKLYCYLHKREKEPFLGKYELLGGLILPNETADETLSRKLKETYNSESIYFQQFGVFSGIDRDPRERAISIAYLALINQEQIQHLDEWHPYAEITKLAFDHKQILESAYQYLQQNLNLLVVRQFMPKYFALNDLQKVYEVIEGKTYDNRNFRKKMILSGMVKETKKKEKAVSHRPAIMYQFTK